MLIDVVKKHVKIITLVLFMALFTSAVVVFSYKYFSQDGNDTSNDAVVAPVQTQEEISDRVTRSDQFRAIIVAVNSGDNQKALDLSSVFAEDTANDSIPRLDAYRVCILSAQNLANSDMKLKCYEDAKTLTNSESDETIKSSWLSTLEHAFNGTEPETTSGDDGPQ